MLEVINKKQEIQQVQLSNDACRAFNSHSIIISERDGRKYCQNILIQPSNDVYFWANFYNDSCSKRTRYTTLKEAINSRLEKGIRVFVLQNKTELKEMIKPKT